MGYRPSRSLKDSSETLPGRPNRKVGNVYIFQAPFFQGRDSFSFGGVSWSAPVDQTKTGVFS